MTVPFTALYGNRPRVMPTSGNALPQFFQGLTSGFSAGRARAQEDEVPKLATDAAALGDLMPEGASAPRPLTPEEQALLQRMLRNPATQQWAMQILRGGG